MSDVKKKVTWELKATGVKEAGADLKALGTESSTSSKTMSQLSNAFSIGALQAHAVAAGISMIMQAARLLPEMVGYVTQLNGALADTALQTGIETEKLQALDYLFVQTGQGAGTVATAIRAMTTALNAGAEETSRKGMMIRELGLDYQALTDMHPEAAFFEITSAINKLSTEQDKNMALTEIFGGHYSQTIGAIMRDTGGDIREATDEVIAQGLVIGGDSVAAWDAYGDAQVRVKQELDKLKTESLEPMLPILYEMMDAKTSLAKTVIPAAAEAATNFLYIMSEGLQVLDGWAEGLGLVSSKFEDLPTVLKFAINPIGSAVGAINDGISAMREVDDANDAMTEAFTRQAEATRLASIAMSLMNEDLELTPNQLRAMKAELEALTTVDATSWLETLTQRIEENQIQVTGALGPLDAYSMAELDMAVSVRQSNIALLEQWELMGKNGQAMQDRIQRIRDEIAMLKGQQASLLREPAAASTGGAASREPDIDPKEEYRSGANTKYIEFMEAQRESMIAAEEEYREILLEKRETRFAAELEAEEASWQNRYDVGMHYSDMMAGMLTSAFMKSGEDIGKMWKSLVKQMVAEMVKSGLLSLASNLLGGGSVGIFGQIFGGMVGGKG